MADTEKADIESLYDVLRDALFDHDGQSITAAVFSLSRSLRDLGNANAATPMGAIEAHGKAILDSARLLADAMEGISAAIYRLAEAGPSSAERDHL